MCDPILVTLLKMRPNCSQSSRENATPSCGTSPLACYKEVAPRPPPQGRLPFTREKRVGYWVELLRHYQIFGKLWLAFIKLRGKSVRLPVPVG